MVETCPSCDKLFANRRSLASHKSRFHNELRVSASSSAEHLAKSVKSPDETSDTDSELSHGRESIQIDSDSPNGRSHSKRNDTVDEHDLKDNMESKSKVSAVGSSPSDDEIETEDSSSNSDSASVISSNSSSESVTEKFQLSGNKRKANDSPANNRLVDLLSSIESALSSQSCKEEGSNCFDLLFCYTMKTHFFAELDSWLFTELGKNIEDVLTQEEQYFVDAIIATSNLSDLHKLMNENSTMVKSILKQHEKEKKEKKQKCKI